MLCDTKTTEFITAHIPRKGRSKHYVHPKCEAILNYLLSVRDQEFIKLEDGKYENLFIVKDGGTIKVNKYSMIEENLNE